MVPKGTDRVLPGVTPSAAGASAMGANTAYVEHPRKELSSKHSPRRAQRGAPRAGNSPLDQVYCRE